MAQKKAISKSTDWEPSHLDHIRIKDAQDLKQQEVESLARRRSGSDHPDSDEDNLKAYVTSNWIKDVIFVHNGQECIIGNDIGVRKDICYPWFTEHFDERRRKFCVDPRGTTLKEVDYTSKNKRAYMKATQHKSEQGWRVPKDHDRHFSKFPLEIIEKILGCLVHIPGTAISPKVVPINWKRCFSGPPHYTTNGHSGYTMTVATVPTETEYGSLMVWRKVYENRMDATCLRVCKAWNNIGGRLLYRFHCYEFWTNDPTSEGSPGTWFGGNILRPSPNKPFLQVGEDSLRKFNGRIHKGIRHIKKQVAIEKLVGWVYYDPFLRFLHTIGRKNAALLNTLKFSGEVRCHQCEREHFCHDCLLESFRVYIPIMNVFCPNVQTLVLNIEKDSEFWANTFERKVQELFGELRKLKSVTKLVVEDVLVDGFELPDGDTRMVSTAQLAEPTVAYFRDRRVEAN